MSVPHITVRIVYPAILECQEASLALTGESAVSAAVLHYDAWGGVERKPGRRSLPPNSAGLGNSVSTVLSDYFKSGPDRWAQAQPRLCVVHPLRCFPDALNASPCGLQGQESARRWLYPDPIFYTGVRPYQPQDSFRDIDWRATARYQSFYVKEYDHTSDPAFSLFFNFAVHSEPVCGRCRLFESAVQPAAAVLDQSQRQQR